MAAGTRDIKIRFSGDSSGLARAAQEGENSVSRFSGRTQKVAKVALAGVAGFAVGLGAALKSGVQGIQEGEEAEARFADAISRATPQIRKSAGAFKDYADQVQKSTRFTYEDTLAVGSLLSAQDGVQKAIRNGTTTLQASTQVVLDWATASGTDATTAAKSYAKAMAAPEKATALLRKAGVNLSAEQQELIKKWTKSGNVAAAQAIIQEELRQKFEGSAKAAGETTAGQLVRAQNAFGEVQEQLAVGLLPVLTNLLGKLVAVTAWAQDNPGKVKVIVIVLGTLAAVIGTVSAAITVWSAITRTATAIQAAWNAVMAANPIVLITLAIIALIAVIVLIATKTDFFQKLWAKAWGAIQGAVSAVIEWVKTNWPLLLAILAGPIGLAVLAIVKNFDKIKAAITHAVDWFKALPGRILDAIGDLGSTLVQKGKDLINGFGKGALEAAKSLPFGMGKVVGLAVDGIQKAQQSFSPAKVTQPLGRDFVGGYAKGMGDNTKLVTDKLNDLVAKAREKIASAKDLARSIRDVFRVDLSGGGDEAGSIFDRLRSQADQAELFTQTIRKLRKAGLREDLLQQLVGEGPGSLGSAQQLLTNVGAANQLAGRISSAGRSLGTSEALARTGINVEAPVVNVSVTLDGKEFRAVVRSEVEAKNKATKSAVAAGSKRSAA